MGKKGFVAKEQGRAPWIENYYEGNMRSKGELRLTGCDRILAVGKLGICGGDSYYRLT